MKKLLGPILLIVGVILLGLIIFLLKAAVKPESMFDVVDNQHEIATSTYYTTDISYPKSAQLPEIEMFIQQQKKYSLDDFTYRENEMAGYIDVVRGQRWNLVINTVATTSKKTVSYVVQVYMYTGGAHGITTMHTFTYDQRGTLLNLKDIFEPGVDFYPILSRTSKKYFLEKFPTNQLFSFDDSTAPKPENFSTWYITNDNVVFIFQVYSIGPYSLGIQEFPLSKQSIKNIITENI